MRSPFKFRPLSRAKPRWARNEDPPFARGTTFYNGGAIDTSNLPSSLGGLNLEGKEWVFEDINWNLSSPTQRTNHYVTARIVRNMAPFNLLPGFIVQANTLTTGGIGGVGGAGLCQSEAIGYCDLTAQDFLGVVDEFLPAAGVPPYDLFWCVTNGPTMCWTSLGADATNVIGLNQRVVALIAATSGSTTAGRVAPQVITDGSTTQGVANAAQVQNVIGRALGAATTANTNAPILIYMTDR